MKKKQKKLNPKSLQKKICFCITEDLSKRLSEFVAADKLATQSTVIRLAIDTFITENENGTA